MSDCGLFAAVVCVSLTMPWLLDKPTKIEPPALVAYTARWMAQKARERGVVAISEELALAVAETESGFRCDVVGKHGEIGIMQIKQTTAFTMGFAGGKEALFDCETNIWYGVLYLQRNHEKCGGVDHCTISRYNRGMNSRSLPITAYTQKVKKAMKKAEGDLKPDIPSGKRREKK